MPLTALVVSPSIIMKLSCPPLNVLLVLPGSPESNSGYHARGAAKGLARLGVDCVFAVPDDHVPNSAPVDFRWHPYAKLLEGAPAFYNGRGPNIIHAWTPREVVRTFCVAMAHRHPEGKLVVHIEDNEQFLTEIATGKAWQTLTTLPAEELDRLVRRDCYHPNHGPAWLARASGLTMIIQTLGQFNEWGVPSMLLPPLVDDRLFYPRPLNTVLRTRLGIPDYHVVLVYSGNVHAANETEVSTLYQAVNQLNQQRCPTTLIRTGHGPVSRDAEAWPSAHVTNLGWVERTQLPDILAAADFFVQPGGPDPFNDFRLPSKLPEYFAMGRPVILPKTNLGLIVEHEQEGFVLNRADAPSIAEVIQRLKVDHLLSRRLALGATAFHRRHCNPTRRAKMLLEFYTATSLAREHAAVTA